MSRRWIPDAIPAIQLPSVILPQGVVSRTLWVDGSRTDHYTANGALEKPYKTITEAVDAVPALDISDMANLNLFVIYVMPGNYHETILMTKQIIIVGIDPIACRIDGNIIANVCVFGISNVTLDTLTIQQASYGWCINCMLNTVDITCCASHDFVNCMISNVTVHNSKVNFSNNCQISANLTIQSHGLEPFPPAMGINTAIYLRDAYFVPDASFSFELFDDATTNIYVSHSLLEGEIILVDDATIWNYNSTLLDLDQTLGTYHNYAGYPDEA
jgi:hypothetical protein